MSDSALSEVYLAIHRRAEALRQKKAAVRESLQTDRTAAQPTPAQSPEYDGSVSQ